MTIKILNEKWKVKFLDLWSEPGNQNSDGEPEYDGICSFNNQEIRIQNSLSDRRTRSVIIHELVHAYLRETSHNAGKLGEEETCEFFGMFGEDIMKNFKKIYEKYVSKKKGD